MMRAVVDPHGDVWFRRMPPICADTLIRVPRLLGSDDPRVRDRLLPRTFRDDDDEEQWRRFGASELEHLFAERETLVRKDLASLEPDGDYYFRIRVRARHLPGWIAALNAARLALFELHELEAGDMEADPHEVDGEDRQIALFRIHNMALLQELLIRAKARTGPGEVSWDDDEPSDTGDVDDPDVDDSGGHGEGGDPPDFV